MSQIRIVIVDDHEIIHNGITNILKSESSYEIVGHAFNGEDAVKLATELIPDVIFMDISMPVLNGIEAIKQIKTIQNHIKIIALTQHNDSEYIQQVLIAGGDGYLLKNSKKEEFIEAIKTVLENKRFLSYEVSDLLINSSLQTKKETDEEKIRLTSREIEIIKKIADDKSNQEIANELFISLRTVETHRRNLMQKLKVNSIVALLKYAAKQNIIKL
jgi:DNA-binding NarL/FixJ family response regulator